MTPLLSVSATPLRPGITTVPSIAAAYRKVRRWCNRADARKRIVFAVTGSFCE